MKGEIIMVGDHSDFDAYDGDYYVDVDVDDAVSDDDDDDDDDEDHDADDG